MPTDSPTTPMRTGPPSGPRPGLDAAGELRRLGFDVGVVLGRGGMGEVFRATDPSGRDVAVKLLAPRWADSAEMVQRFEREASVLSRLRHPNLVSLLEFGLAGRTPFFTMELLLGQSLKRVMKGRPLSVRDCLALAISVGRAVDYVHRSGVVHRDLKPSNIIVDSSLRPTVIDFGIAMPLGEEAVTGSGEAIGTAEYMAPEQSRDSHQVDGRADTYSLGLILYELLCGDQPRGVFKLPSERIRDVPKRVDTALLRALAADPADRHPTLAELADELTQALVDAPAADAAAAPSPAPAQVQSEPGRVEVSLTGALDGASVAPAADALAHALEGGAPRDLVYELSRASDVTLAAIRPLAQVHQVHRARIRRIGLCASVPVVRASALVLASAVPQISARVFATHSSLDRWLTEAAR